MKNKNIVIFDINLFKKNTGASEQLLIDFARILSNVPDYTIWCIYGTHESNELPADLLLLLNIKFIQLNISSLSKLPPHKPIGNINELNMALELIENPIFISLVYSDDQWPINSISKSIPMLLISAFGNFCSNGNVRKLYVAGKGNTKKLHRRGIKIAEQFYHPLHAPAFPINKFTSIDKQVLIGRSGRDDPGIFDPISIKAFAILESIYGNKVKFIYLNPCDEAINLALNLQIKNIEFKPWQSKLEIDNFYNSIHIFAHSRYDGETLGISIAEALINKCVVVSHKSKIFNEHLNLLKAPFGLHSGVDDFREYFIHLKYFVDNRMLLEEFGSIASEETMKLFSFDSVSLRIKEDCKYLFNFSGKPLPLITRFRHFLRSNFFYKKELLKRVLHKLLPNISNKIISIYTKNF